MATGTISIPRKAIDFKYITGTYGSGFTVNAHTAVDASSHCGSISIPSGYSQLLTGIEINGDGRVVPSGFGTTWIVNTSASTSNTIKTKKWALCVKYG